jgi:SAM-dependent methyltransferase
MTIRDDAYWNSFYGSVETKQLDLPSQFAVFFLNEVDRKSTIVDVGCGTGRDSLFFASQGARVIGVDGSSTAVDLCTNKAKVAGYSNAEFMAADVADPTLPLRLRERAGPRVCVYARFFLHAIPEEAEGAFLKLASQLADQCTLAVEFRTDRDAQQAKVTPDHYRRFIKPATLIARAAAVGFAPMYFTEGFGFAKYKMDDAHVARVVFKKTD